jgi:hypothetical protein
MTPTARRSRAVKISYAAAFWRVFFWAEDQVMKLPPWSIFSGRES